MDKALNTFVKKANILIFLFTIQLYRKYLIQSGNNVTNDIQASAAIYNKTVLKIYDFWVHGFSNHYLWRCPTSHLIALYQQSTSNNHLEVGVGTGFFLQRVPFTQLKPRLVLMDLNPNTLEIVSQKLQRFQPAGVINDILAGQQPNLPLFDSIAFNYVWHCLPAEADKAQAFANLAKFLQPNGVLFGSTLLAKDISQNLAAKALMKLYQHKGIFGNQYDDLTRLETALQQNFSRYHIQQIGSAAIFSAWK